MGIKYGPWLFDAFCVAKFQEAHGGKITTTAEFAPQHVSPKMLPMPCTHAKAACTQTPHGGSVRSLVFFGAAQAALISFNIVYRKFVKLFFSTGKHERFTGATLV